MGLKDDYSDLYNSWYDAGGEDYFAIHLHRLGIREVLDRDLRNMVLGKLEDAVDNVRYVFDTFPF